MGGATRSFIFGRGRGGDINWYWGGCVGVPGSKALAVPLVTHIGYLASTYGTLAVLQFPCVIYGSNLGYLWGYPRALKVIVSKPNRIIKCPFLTAANLNASVHAQLGEKNVYRGMFAFLRKHNFRRHKLCSVHKRTCCCFYCFVRTRDNPCHYSLRDPSVLCYMTAVQRFSG